MKSFTWSEYLGQTLNVIMNENYGLVRSDKGDEPHFYEIVFKTGKLVSAFDEGILLETSRENHFVKIFIPYSSIKCVEIYNI